MLSLSINSFIRNVEFDTVSPKTDYDIPFWFYLGEFFFADTKIIMAIVVVIIW